MIHTTTIRELFVQHQHEMLVALQGDRQILQHPTTKGDASELRWIDMLAGHLPRRYAVAKAFVLDCAGAISEQVDVVVYDCHYTPLLRSDRGARFIPAEGIYAVFEVRQELSKRNLMDAAEKVASVRRLHRTSAPIPYAEGQHPPRTPQHILGGLLTLRSSWNPPFGESFAKVLADTAGDHRLDLGCCLRDGSWRASGGESAQPTHSEPRAALISYFLDLLQSLQSVATVPAIDFSEYSRNLLEA